MSSDERLLRARGISPGTAIGTAYIVEPDSPSFFRIRIAPSDVEEELHRTRKALRRSRRQLRVLQGRLEPLVGVRHARIIDSHLMILQDRKFLQEIRRRIQDKMSSPERAVQATTEKWLRLYESLEDPFFRQRGSELEEVADRLIANLSDLKARDTRDLPSDLVLVAPEMSLRVLAEFQLDRVKGLVLSKGGRTSHVNIVARSCRMPVVIGLDEISRIATGDTIIVDGSEGTVLTSPSSVELKRSGRRVEVEREETKKLEGDREGCRTIDGRDISILANTEVAREVALGLRLGAAGIGLFRSEFIFAGNTEEAVSEKAQFAVYRRLASTVDELPATIRTLDIGGEAHPYFGELAGFDRPILGLRGIRMSLRHPELFRRQIRAILRARKYGNLRIVLPMVSTPGQIRDGRAIIDEVAGEVHGPDSPEPPVAVGALIEVPAAVLSLESIASECDFLAVGTNDLLQFTLAVDRNDDRVSELFDPCHPGFLQILKRIADVSSRIGKETVVCGEVASSPAFAALLVGMGFTSLSMNPFGISQVKAALRKLSWEDMRTVVEEVLLLGSGRAVRGKLEDSFRQNPSAHLSSHEIEAEW